MPEVVREAVEGAEPVRIIFWGGDLELKTKKGRLQQNFQDANSWGGKHWLWKSIVDFWMGDSPMICLQQKESRIEHFEKPRA